MKVDNHEAQEHFFTAEFGELSRVIESAWDAGGADIALPDLDPDAALSARFLAQNMLPTSGTRILSGNGGKTALLTRAPQLADFEVCPISALATRNDARPLFLLDASRIDQPNVGGPKGIIPDVVLDTHVGQRPNANRVTLLSSEHVATGSLLTEFARFKEGEESEFWQSDKVRKDCTGLRFGIYTDSGENNYATSRDRNALRFLQDHSNLEIWRELQETPFFLKVQSLYERGSRIYEVRSGLFHVSFRKDELAGCRDYLGAVSDRLLQHMNGIAVLATGEISRGEETLFCAALRLNRNHRGFESFDAVSVLGALKRLGGGFGSQINGQVWGGSVVTSQSGVVESALVSAYFDQAELVHQKIGGMKFK